jgi:hypothetical protein
MQVIIIRLQFRVRWFISILGSWFLQTNGNNRRRHRLFDKAVRLINGKYPPPINGFNQSEQNITTESNFSAAKKDTFFFDGRDSCRAISLSNAD